MLKEEGEDRAAVVQTVDAPQRIAHLLLQDNNKIERASILELQTYGTGLNGPESAVHETIGVHIGDFIFVHKPGTTNGSYGAKVPRIGEIEPWVHEHREFDNPEGWRRQMHDIGCNIASQRGSGGSMDRPLRLPVRGSGELSWCGEVTAVSADEPKPI